jgi:hypothetical protein
MAERALSRRQVFARVGAAGAVAAATWVAPTIVSASAATAATVPPTEPSTPTSSSTEPVGPTGPSAPPEGPAASPTVLGQDLERQPEAAATDPSSVTAADAVSSAPTFTG